MFIPDTEFKGGASVAVLKLWCQSYFIHGRRCSLYLRAYRSPL